MLFTSFAFSQGVYIEIKLVQPYVGGSNFSGVVGIDTASNDPGLNAILQAYNITYYMEKGGHVYPPFLGKFTETMCQTSQVSQLLNDLLHTLALLKMQELPIMVRPSTIVFTLESIH